MQTIIQDLEKIIKKDSRLVSDEGEILKNKVSELAFAYDETLIKLLFDNTPVRKQFFVELKDKQKAIFKADDFVAFVNRKEFLPDSFTKFKNRIGLHSGGEYLKDNGKVVLAFPYKDCVLEGGQDKEDQKRDEVFYNEVLAPDEIDRLFEPKVLNNFIKIDKDGEKDVNQITAQDNLMIKGNNLLALHSIKNKYRGKIKLIYIDPPYNPDSKSNTFAYNNKFNESTWLTFMKNRLEIAKTLLTEDGCMIVAIDENEQAELKVLLKEIFRGYEVHSITIVHNPRGVQGTNFSYTHEYALFVIPEGKKSIGNRKIDEDGIVWRNLRDNGGESLRTDAKNCFYPMIVENDIIVGFGDIAEKDFHPEKSNIKHGNQYYIYPIDKEGIERKWRYARQSVDEIKHLLRAKKSRNGIEIEIGKDFGTYRTVWIDSRYDANEYGTKLVKSLVPNCKFDFPKSVYNVYDCLYAVVGNDKNAIVLDFFAGSGTTAHALLMMNKEDEGNRKFILCEQMHYVDTITKERVKQVIKNDKKGSFIYAELKEWNQEYLNEIEEAKNASDISKIYKKFINEPFFRYDVDLTAFDEKEFAKLKLDDQKKVLLECLDKNHLYVNYCDIDDSTYKVSTDDKKMNRLFYESK